MASGPTFTRRKGRGFPGLLSNALQPLSKASSSDSGGSHGSARLSTRWGNRTSKKFGAVKEKNSNTQQGLASAPKEENDSSSGQVARDPKGAAAAAASSGQHGLIELCILDGLNLPLQKDQKAFFLIDFDSEFSKTPYASIPEDGKPLWNHTSTQSGYLA